MAEEQCNKGTYMNRVNHREISFCSFAQLSCLLRAAMPAPVASPMPTTVASPLCEAYGTCVAFTLALLNQFLPTLQFSHLRHNGFAQQEDRLNLVGIGHMEGDVLRADLRVAP